MLSPDSVNAQKAGGFRDWRLPDIDELCSLFSAGDRRRPFPGLIFPELALAYETGDQHGLLYWSCSRVKSDYSIAGYADFFLGSRRHADASRPLRVRLVRGPD